MGYGCYEITRQDGQTIEAGYEVEATCERPDCDAKIDRGLAYLCGKTPGGDEHGCGGYFCGQHLYGDNQCEPCAEAADKANAWIHPGTGEEFDLRDQFLPAGGEYDARGPVWKHQGEWRDGAPVLAHVYPHAERLADTDTRLLTDGEWEDVGRIIHRQMQAA